MHAHTLTHTNNIRTSKIHHPSIHTVVCNTTVMPMYTSVELGHLCAANDQVL